MTRALANIFGVSPLALSVPDIDGQLGLMHTFFALEDLYGPGAECEDGTIVLKFNDKKVLDPSFAQMLFVWTEQKKKLRNGEVSKEEYDKWRYNYPEYDDTQIFAEVMSQELSDVVLGELKKS